MTVSAEGNGHKGVSEVGEGHELRGSARTGFLMNLSFSCNYRCAYCWHDDWWEEHRRTGPFPLAVEQWIRCWDRVGSEYGSLEIEIVGGEPFVFPGFLSLLRSLTQKNLVIVTTNLSQDRAHLQELVDSVNWDGLRLAASFHPHFADLGEFLKKISYMKSRGISITTNIVAYPPFLSELKEYCSRFRREGLDCNVWVFTGRYNGRDYPGAYTPAEVALLKEHMPDRRAAYNLFRKETLGKPCHSGRSYAVVMPDGLVQRCGMVREPIGNIFDKDFRLSTEPLPCPVRECACSEYRFLDQEQPTES